MHHLFLYDLYWKDGILTAIMETLEERNKVPDSQDAKRPAIPESPWKKEKREKQKRLEQEAKRQEEERLSRLKYEQELQRQQELQHQNLLLEIGCQRKEHNVEADNKMK